MGKQTSKILKTKAEQIYDTLKDKFTTDFENNKKIVIATHLFDYSVLERNIVAGHVTKIVKREAARIE